VWTRNSKRRWHWPLPSFASDTGLLLSLYRGMVLTRAFDLKAVSLQRTGRLGTYATSLGQEAVSVGVASAMREEDAVFTSYRDNGTLLWRGLGGVQAGCD
jgi:2-oxoisovalerate dehydrogenase E1 component alpha subunit